MSTIKLLPSPRLTQGSTTPSTEHLTLALVLFKARLFKLSIIKLYYHIKSKMSGIVDNISKYFGSPVFSCKLSPFSYRSLVTGLFIRVISPLFIATFYCMLAVHVYAYTEVILFVLKKRLGTTFGLIWVSIGIALLYNIVFNHLSATFIKPGSPLDLKVKLKPFTIFACCIA